MTAPNAGLGGPPRPQEVAGLDGPKAIQVPVLREAPGTSFADTLKQTLSQVTELSETSRDYVQAFLRGEPVELHQVMAASEEAGIAIDLLIQVRNKFLEAYKTVMTMTT
jgi:flagellar hook-basal body complex protein FliE